MHDYTLVTPISYPVTAYRGTIPLADGRTTDVTWGVNGVATTTDPFNEVTTVCPHRSGVFSILKRTLRGGGLNGFRYIDPANNIDVEVIRNKVDLGQQTADAVRYRFRLAEDKLYEYNPTAKGAILKPDGSSLLKLYPSPAAHPDILKIDGEEVTSIATRIPLDYDSFLSEKRPPSLSMGGAHDRPALWYLQQMTMTDIINWRGLAGINVHRFDHFDPIGVSNTNTLSKDRSLFQNFSLYLTDQWHTAIIIDMVSGIETIIPGWMEEPRMSYNCFTGRTDVLKPGTSTPIQQIASVCPSGYMGVILINKDGRCAVGGYNRMYQTSNGNTRINNIEIKQHRNVQFLSDNDTQDTLGSKNSGQVMLFRMHNNTFRGPGMSSMQAWWTVGTVNQVRERINMLHSMGVADEIINTGTPI